MNVLLKMALTESVPEPVFEKGLGFTMSGNDRVFDGFCGRAFSVLRLWRTLF